ncbi:hypothetical protein ACQP2P_08590 [Dactylosporangium sp. CA-139114]|uniref:hypothetical protein n=1 Tax=Dactylosporangium sp. CA-139114 TaxID=3239931 RepID=UPI003D971425
MRKRFGAMLLVAALALAGCGGDGPGAADPGGHESAAAAGSSAPGGAEADPAGVGALGAAPGPSSTGQPAAAAPFAFGNPSGKAAIPAEARAESTAQPTKVVGDGSPASCTSESFVSAVSGGGVITFNCGPGAVTIVVKQTAKVRNRSAKVVIDGGGKVTLSGEAKRRILYQNTCDKSLEWTTDHCQDQATPALTVQNIVFADGNSTGDKSEGGGGGAIFVRGGRFKAVNTKFVRNRCDDTGPDLGGAAVRVLSQYQNKPVYIVGSTFGGASGQGGVCANGGALSSIQVSWVVLNSLFSYNSAVGRGANPARSGTPGGGSGGAIYCDGDNFTVRLAGTLIEQNKANEGGGAVFFVSNDRTGTMSIEGSTLRKNPSAGFETDGFPGIFFLGARPPSVSGSTLSR